MSKQIIHTDQAPAAIGPYSQANLSGGFVFTAGQIALTPGGDGTLPDDVADQARQALSNLRAVLQAAGTDLAHVVKTTVFLLDMADYATVNAVYAEFFTENHPARSAVQVAGLPAGARVEIEAVAALP